LSEALADRFPLVFIGRFGNRYERCDSALVRTGQIANLFYHIRAAIAKLAQQLAWIGLESGYIGGGHSALARHLGVGELGRQHKGCADEASNEEPNYHLESPLAKS
jgi:hypothetical protein